MSFIIPAAEELAALLEPAITSAEFLAEETPITSEEGLFGEATTTVHNVQRPLRFSRPILGGALAATTTTGLLNLPKERTKKMQTIKVEHSVKRKHYGASRRYKTGKRTRRYKRTGKTNTNAVKSFNTSTRGAAVAGAYNKRSGYHIVSRTMIPRAQGLETADMKTTLNNDVFNNGNGAGSFGYDFKLSDFTNYTDFTDMFRFYKILWVKLYFYPEQNCHVSARVSEGTSATMAYGDLGYANSVETRSGRAPTLVCAPDQTSASGLSDFTVGMSHDKARFHMFNDSKEFMVYLVPTTLQKVGATSNVDTHGKPMWISTASPDEPHYGLRCFADGFHNATSVKVIMTMKVAFKDLKH